jgi:hypothetical protein
MTSLTSPPHSRLLLVSPSQYVGPNSEREQFCLRGFRFPCCSECTRLYLRWGLKRVVGCKRVHTRVEGTWVGKSYTETEREERAKTRSGVL